MLVYPVLGVDEVSVLKISRNQTGVVLVFVLLMLVLLSVMAGSFSNSMRGGASIIHNKKSQLHNQEFVNAGVAYAEYMMTQPVENQRWLATGVAYQINFESELIEINIYDEAGKFNINQLDKLMLLGVLKSVVSDTVQAGRLADSILDWIDADDDVRENGAERMVDSHQYAASTSKDEEYRPANRPFLHLAELMLVKGMTDDIYQDLRPLLTTQAIKKLDLGVATKQVLTLLSEVFGVGESWVQQIMLGRLAVGDQVFIPYEMREYATIKTSQRGLWVDVSVALSRTGNKRSVTNVLMRRKAGDAFPLFVEIDRRLVSG